MPKAILFYDEKKIFFFEGKTNQQLIEPLQIDSFNKFVSGRLSNLIQSNIIDKGMEIAAVIFDSRDGLLLPNELYNPEKREEFYKLNYSKIPQGKIIKEQQINAINATLIYSCKQWFHDFFNDNFKDTPILNSSSLYLKKCISDRDFKDIHIIIKRDTFDIVKFKNNTLLSYNSIEYTSSNDIIYFLIGHLEKMKLQKPAINISGNKSKLKEIETITNKMDSLKKYTYHYNANTNLFELIT